VSLQDILKLAKSALVERKVRAILTILMVMVGTSLMIALNGLSAGQAALVQKQFSSLAPNVLTVSAGQRGFGPQAGSSTPSIVLTNVVVDRIKSLPFVTDVIPTYQGSVSLESQGNTINASVLAIDPQKIRILSPSLELEEGSAIRAGDPSAILVGANIANPAGRATPLVTVGQTVRLTFNFVDQTTGKQDEEVKSFIVSGVMLLTGSNQLDNALVMNMSAGDSLLHRGGRYDGMRVVAQSSEYVDAVQQQITALYGNTIGVTTPRAILTAIGQFQSGNASFIQSIAIIALIVGTIGIVTTLYTSVNERTKEIGTMKAIGASGKFILSLFLAEAIIIGLIGSTVGLVAGVAGGYLLTSGLTPAQPGPGGRPGQLVPVFILTDMANVWALSVGMSIVAGLYPAWKASRLTPLVALRKE